MRYCRTALLIAVALACGYVVGAGPEDPVEPDPLPQPRWEKDSPMAKELDALIVEAAELLDPEIDEHGALWFRGMDRTKLSVFRRYHEQLLRLCQEHESKCRKAYEENPDTMAHKALYLQARSMADCALNLLLAQDEQEVDWLTTGRPGEPDIPLADVRKEDMGLWIFDRVFYRMPGYPDTQDGECYRLLATTKALAAVRL